MTGASGKPDRVLSPAATEPVVSAHSGDAPLRVAAINSGLFTSDADDWTTPQGFFDALDAEFCFTLDPCAYAHTAKCKSFFTKADDGLRQEWRGSVFVNPPYGRVIGAWVKKAYEAAQTTADVVVLLIPARTCSRYWHDYCMRADEIRFVRGRLQFGGIADKAHGAQAPFPNAVIVFRKGRHAPRVSSVLRCADNGQGILFGEAA